MAWATVIVIDVPSIMPAACDLFDKLKLAKNYLAERPSLAGDTGAVAAKEFALGV